MAHCYDELDSRPDKNAIFISIKNTEFQIANSAIRLQTGLFYPLATRSFTSLSYWLVIEKSLTNANSLSKKLFAGKTMNRLYFQFII